MSNRIRFGYRVEGATLRVFWPGEALAPCLEAEGAWLNPCDVRAFVLRAWRELSEEDQRLALALFLNQPSPVPDYLSFGEREFVYALLTAPHTSGTFKMIPPPQQ